MRRKKKDCVSCIIQRDRLAWDGIEIDGKSIIPPRVPLPLLLLMSQDFSEQFFVSYLLFSRSQIARMEADFLK